MRRLGKGLERLLARILPSKLEEQPTKPTESASPARRSRPVPPRVASPAAEAKTIRKPRPRTPLPDTRHFGECNRRLPIQGKPAAQRPKFQRDEAYERS